MHGHALPFFFFPPNTVLITQISYNLVSCEINVVVLWDNFGWMVMITSRKRCTNDQIIVWSDRNLYFSSDFLCVLGLRTYVEYHCSVYVVPNNKLCLCALVLSAQHTIKSILLYLYRSEKINLMILENIRNSELSCVFCTLPMSSQRDPLVLMHYRTNSFNVMAIWELEWLSRLIKVNWEGWQYSVHKKLCFVSPNRT